MSKRLMLSEIIEKAEAMSSSDAVEFLRQHDSGPLRLILELNFDKNLKWNLPEGAPPFKVSEFPEDRLALYREARKLPMFTNRDERSTSIHKIKMEGVYINILESVPKEEADLLIRLKDGQIKLKKSIYEKAFGVS